MDDQKPLVSVIIPTYNYADFLPKAIESVVGQTYKNIEVIVIDDGSTDNTGEIIKPYLEGYRLVYIKQENKGLPNARNRGISESKREYLAFLDADDVWLPTKLEKQVPLFSDPKVGLVYSKRILMDKHGDERPFEHPKLYRGNVLNQIFINNFVCASSVAIRKDCFKAVGGFDETLPTSEDYDMWVRVALNYHFDYVDEPLVKYRVGHGQMSDKKEKRFEYVWKIMNRIIEEPTMRKRLSWWVIPYAKAHTYGTMGNYYFQFNRPLSLKYYVMSLRYNPSYIFSWKGLIKIILSSIIVILRKRLCPIHW